MREGRKIVAMNQVMSDAGVSRLARENTIQDFSRFLLFRVSFVRRHGPGSDE